MRTECAQQALTAGTPITDGASPRIASGVIQAGVVCRGDSTTYYALRAIAYPNEPDDPGVDAAESCACVVCGRDFITPGTADDAEDVAQRATKNSPLCWACYNTARRSGTLRPLRLVVPDRCVTCRKPMTPYEEPREGSVRHKGGGNCVACYMRLRRATPAVEAA